MTIFDKIRNSEIEFHGMWRVIPSSALTEIVAQSGFDFQILDCEHGAYDYGTLSQDIIACEQNGCAPFVRVSGLNKVEVQRCLDIGAYGIVFPSLDTADDFKKAADLLSYPPIGTRGYNPFVRANKYGINDAQTLVRPLCITILETLKAIDELDNILMLEGIDIFYIGSYDLSAQLGCIGQMNAPELVAVIDNIIKKCINQNKPVALMVHSKEQHVIAVEKKVRGFVHSVDSFKIKTAFCNYLDKF